MDDETTTLGEAQLNCSCMHIIDQAQGGAASIRLRVPLRVPLLLARLPTGGSSAHDAESREGGVEEAVVPLGRGAPHELHAHNPTLGCARGRKRKKIYHTKTSH